MIFSYLVVDLDLAKELAFKHNLGYYDMFFIYPDANSKEDQEENTIQISKTFQKVSDYNPQISCNFIDYDAIYSEIVSKFEMFVEKVRKSDLL